MLQGSLDVGCKDVIVGPSLGLNSSGISTNIPIQPQVPQSTKPRKKNLHEVSVDSFEDEPEDVKCLSNTQLQRLGMVEQLKLIRVKQRRLEDMMKEQEF
jgi:hypothetical protein